MMHPSRLPFSGAHWADHVARHAFAIGDSVAIRYEGESITWARLHDRVRRAAAAFAGQGVRPGDRVAVLMTNRPEFVESVLAANAIGAIAVPVNFRLAAPAPVIATGSGGSYEALLEEALADKPRPGEARPGEARPGAGEGEVVIDERDVALIMYTSGTTAAPKAPCSPT